MKRISPEFLDELINFCPENSGASKSVGELQRRGTVAAFNMLAVNGCAYIADEVGMGKTYVALGVMNLLRYFNPRARIAVIAPRQNIQLKWEKELTNFVRNNWQVNDNRVKSLENTPVWNPVICENLASFAHESLLNQDRDFFLKMSSFSLVANTRENRDRARCRLMQAIRWLKKSDLDVSDPKRFLDSYGIALNGAMPVFDLVVVDEAHNLKAGFGDRVSNRNRVMGMAFGHNDGEKYEKHWFGPKASRVLLLSATPFESEYSDIYRQLQVFGLDNRSLCTPQTAEALPIEKLSNGEAQPGEQKAVVERLMIRRNLGLLINGEKHTKNMYRREWRRGGVRVFDQPISIDDTKTRLIVALMQKKVSEVLQTEKFNNNFQIGMLSSFESFAQSVDTADRAKFDGTEQQRDLPAEEKDGVDSNVITQVTQSYEELFGSKLPHPKLDQVADNLKNVFNSGEKSLIFVRRIATVGELAGKLNVYFNTWIRSRMESSLPELRSEIEEIFDLYQQEVRADQRKVKLDEDHSESNDAPSDLKTSDDVREDFGIDEDAGGIKSFFEWFFRGSGPSGWLSGTAFQKNRISSTGSTYSTIFESNFVAEILNVGVDECLRQLAEVCSLSQEDCEVTLRAMAWPYCDWRKGKAEGYPRLYVYESYQWAGLKLLSNSDSASEEIKCCAQIVLQERFEDQDFDQAEQIRDGFPEPETHLSTTTIFTELKSHDELRNELWPHDQSKDFRSRFRRSEQRRELFSAQARLGASYIDLYLLAIKGLGSFQLRSQDQSIDNEVSSRLAKSFIDLLYEQRTQNGFLAYTELAETSNTFDTLISVNFPDLESQPLSKLTRYFGEKLGHQMPVGESTGQVNNRIVAQFRMPGYPLVLISTDVLQEGEDLHTFCKNILHYGIAWTPSSLEQRNGRVDRIGGLVQRSLDGLEREPQPEEFIQVFYPHLRDTVELLQVRRVLKRLNAFIERMHEGVASQRVHESRINGDKAVHEEVNDIDQYKKELKSAFEVQEQWLDGQLQASDVSVLDWKVHREHFEGLISSLRDSFEIKLSEPRRAAHEIQGEVKATPILDVTETSTANSDRTSQHFVLRLRSNIHGEHTLLQCESRLDKKIDENDGEELRRLATKATQLEPTKLCIEHHQKQQFNVFTRQEILFSPDLTQFEEARILFESVTAASAKERSDSVRHEDNQYESSLFECVRQLLDESELNGYLDDKYLTISIDKSIRNQKIELQVKNQTYKFKSKVARVIDIIESPDMDEKDLILRILQRNALRLIVNLYIDRDGWVIGEVVYPAAHTQIEEIHFYLVTLARDCDRFEYILSGEDQH